MDLLFPASPVCSAHDGMADIDELNTRRRRFDSALGYIANRNLRSSAAGFANKLEAIIRHDIPAKSTRVTSGCWILPINSPVDFPAMGPTCRKGAHLILGMSRRDIRK